MRFILRIKKFFVEIFRSSYDMEFYRGVRQRPFGMALKYLAGLVLVFALFQSAAAATAGSRALTGLREHLEKNIPASSAVTITDGKLSANFPTPADLGTDDAPVIVDPSIEGTVLTADAPKNFAVLVGRDALFYRGSEREWRSTSFVGITGVKLTREDVLSGISSYGWLGIALVALLVLLIFFSAAYAARLIFVAITSTVARFAGRMFGAQHLSYKQWFAVGCHAVTLPSIIVLVMRSGGLYIPFSFTIIYALFLLAVLVDERQRPVVTPAQPPQAPVA